VTQEDLLEFFCVWRPGFFVGKNLPGCVGGVTDPLFQTSAIRSDDGLLKRSERKITQKRPLQKKLANGSVSRADAADVSEEGRNIDLEHSQWIGMRKSEQFVRNLQTTTS